MSNGMTGVPFISVVIPTCNRSALLAQTVDTLLAQSYPPDEWELILVDNNSTDDTWAVIQRLAESDPRIRGLQEPRRGAHFARNSGALLAQGSVLYFTDDDMLADRFLLERVIEGFAADPKIASVTGKVL